MILSVSFSEFLFCIFLFNLVLKSYSYIEIFFCHFLEIDE